MSESERVQRGRQRQRQAGKEPLTIWLTSAEKLRLEDQALSMRCSPSELVQHALAHLRGESPPVTATVTDTEQVRAIVQQELAHASTVTATVTDMVTATLEQTLPGLVRTLMEARQAGTVTATVTDTVTDTPIAPRDDPRPEAAPERGADTVADMVTDTDPKHRGRKPVLREPILALLREHQAGLTAAELKVYLHTEKPIGDTLSGMVKAELLVKAGSGQAVRYQLATAEAKRREVSA